MNGKASKEKGKRGEREVVNKLKALMPHRSFARNLQQTREGGCDILGAEPFAIEVKNRSSLAVPTWWKQTLKQAEASNLKPALIFKAKGKWNVKVDDSKNYLTIENFVKLFEDYEPILTNEHYETNLTNQTIENCNCIEKCNECRCEEL